MTLGIWAWDKMFLWEKVGPVKGCRLEKMFLGEKVG